MALPKFTPKNQRSTKNSILGGVNVLQLATILWNNKQYIEYGTYWYKIILLFIQSIIVSFFACIQFVMFSGKIKRAKVNDRVVFVIGHFRCGTTLLHNVLSKDTDQFIFPKTLDVGCTSATLLESYLEPLVKSRLSSKRPMDNVPLNLHQPREDDAALMSLQGGECARSIVVFPRKRKEALARLVAESTPSTPEANKVKDAILYLYRMLSVKYGSERRILSKSIEHIARVKTLLTMFPNAQFIFIRRNPYRMYRSMVNLIDTLNWCHFLSTPTKDELYSLLFDRFPIFMDAYFEAKDQIPKGNLVEVAFEDFQNNMMGEVERIYRELGWDFENAQGNLQTYVDSIKSYNKNSFASISSEERALVNKHWGKYFAMLGYDMIEDDVDVDISNM